MTGLPIQQQKIEKIVEYIFSSILKLQPLKVEHLPTTIVVTLPEDSLSIIGHLNFTTLLVSYGFPVTSHEVKDHSEQIVFYLFPDYSSNFEEISTNLVSRWAESKVEVDSNKDLETLFRQNKRINLVANWQLWDRYVDLVISGPGLEFTVYSYQFSPKLEYYTEPTEKQRNFLQNTWNIIYQPIRVRSSLNKVTGTVELSINKKPGVFGLRSMAEESLLSWYEYSDGKYHQISNNSSTADENSLRSLIEIWNTELWKYFY